MGSQQLDSKVDTLQQEARMVLPGIQALVGFQLIAIFNTGFKASLTESEQVAHLVALILVVISSVLVMAPAAYHRQAHHQISKHFVELSSRFLAWAMAPLALGTCLDIYNVARVILLSQAWSIGVAGLVFLFYLWFWLIFPQQRARKANT